MKSAPLILFATAFLASATIPVAAQGATSIEGQGPAPLVESGHEANIPSDGGLAPSGPGDHAVDDNVDGEAKPVAVAGDHLDGVSGEQRKSVGR